MSSVSSPQYGARRVVLSGVLGNNCNSCLYYELHAVVLDLFMSILELGFHLAAHVIYVQEMDVCMLSSLRNVIYIIHEAYYVLSRLVIL